jgi:integrase
MAILFEEAGVKVRAWDGRSAHTLRRTAASDVLDAAGGDLQIVQQMLGHKHLSSTSHYLRLKPPAGMRAAMEGRSYSPAAD